MADRVESRWSRLLSFASMAPVMVAISIGLPSILPSNGRTPLLCIGAAVVIVGVQFVVPPADEGEANPIVVSFLRSLPGIFTAISLALIVLSIAFSLPNTVAVIPLFGFVFFAAIPTLMRVLISPPVSGDMYTVMALSYLISILALVAFAVLVLASLS